MDDIWTMRLSDEVAADVVDAFLDGRVREHEHLDYRARIDPDGDIRGARNRLVETVAAMANTGGTGLILVGVAEDGSGDRPEKRWLLKAGELREQAIEAKCRELEPYVPVEIGRATCDLGDVVIIRIPDFQDRPVFLRDHGILVRRGQSNVPASPTEIRSWLQDSSLSAPQHLTGFHYNFLDLTNKPSPALNLGVTPGRRWSQRRWNDETDNALAVAVREIYRSIGELRIGDGVVQFGTDHDEEEGQFLSVSSDAEIVRLSRPPQVSELGRCDLVSVGVEVARTWAFAQAVLPEVFPRFPGPATLHLSIGGVGQGFGFFPSRSTLFMADVIRAPLRQRDNWRKQWPELPLAVEPEEVAGSVVSEMLRAFGYRQVSPWLNLVRKACEGISGHSQA